MEIWGVMIFVLTFCIAVSNSKIWRHKSRRYFKEYTSLSLNNIPNITCQPNSGHNFFETNMILRNNTHRHKRKKRAPSEEKEEVVEKSTRILPDFFLVHNQRTKSKKRTTQKQSTTESIWEDTTKYSVDYFKYYTKSNYKHVPLILFPELKHSSVLPETTVKNGTIVTKMEDYPDLPDSTTTEKNIRYANYDLLVSNKRSEFGVHRKAKHLISQPFSPMYYNQLPKPMHKSNMDNQKQVNFLLSLVPKPKAEFIQINETSFQIHPRYNKSVKDQQIATKSYDPLAKPSGVVENFHIDKMVALKDYEPNSNSIKFKVPEPIDIHNKKTTPFPYNMLDHSDEPSIVDKIKSIMAQNRRQMVTKKEKDDLRFQVKGKTTPFSVDKEPFGVQKVKFLLSKTYNRAVTKNALNDELIRRFGPGYTVPIAKEKADVKLAADAFFLLFIYPNLIKSDLKDLNLHSHIDKSNGLTVSSTKKSMFEEFLSKKSKHKAGTIKTSHYFEKYGKNIPKNKPIYIVSKTTTTESAFKFYRSTTNTNRPVIFVNQNNEEKIHTSVDYVQKSKPANNISNSETFQSIEQYFNKEPLIKHKSIEENTIPTTKINDGSFSDRYLQFIAERAPVLGLYQEAVGTPDQSKQNYDFLRDIFPQNYLDFLNDERVHQKTVDDLQEASHYEYLKILGEKAAVLHLYPTLDKPEVRIQNGGHSQSENDYLRSGLFPIKEPEGVSIRNSDHNSTRFEPQYESKKDERGLEKYPTISDKINPLTKLRYLSLINAISPVTDFQQNNFDPDTVDPNYQQYYFLNNMNQDNFNHLSENPNINPNFDKSPEEFDAYPKLESREDQYSGNSKYIPYQKDSFLLQKPPTDESSRYSNNYPRNMPYQHNQDYYQSVPNKDYEVGSEEEEKETNPRYNFDINFVPQNIALKVKKYQEDAYNYDEKDPQYLKNRRYDQLPPNNYNSKQLIDKRQNIQNGRNYELENQEWQPINQISDLIQNRKKDELFGKIYSKMDEIVPYRDSNSRNLLDNRKAYIDEQGYKNKPYNSPINSGEDKKREAMQRNERLRGNNFEKDGERRFEINHNQIKQEEERRYRDLYNSDFGNRYRFLEPEKNKYDINEIDNKNRKKEKLFAGNFDDFSKQDTPEYQKEFKYDVNIDHTRKKKEKLFDNDNFKPSKDLKYEDKITKKEQLFGRNLDKEPYNYYEMNNFIPENSIKPPIDLRVPIDHYRTDFKTDNDIQSRKEELFLRENPNFRTNNLEVPSQNNLESNSGENNKVVRRTDRNSKKQHLFRDFITDKPEARFIVRDQNVEDNQVKYTFIYPSKNPNVKHSSSDKTTKIYPFYRKNNFESNFDSENKHNLPNLPKHGSDGFDIDWIDFSTDTSRKVN